MYKYLILYKIKKKDYVFFIRKILEEKNNVQIFS